MNAHCTSCCTIAEALLKNGPLLLFEYSKPLALPPCSLQYSVYFSTTFYEACFSEGYHEIFAKLLMCLFLNVFCHVKFAKISPYLENKFFFCQELRKQKQFDIYDSLL
jgi:hypothetical protein